MADKIVEKNVDTEAEAKVNEPQVAEELEENTQQRLDTIFDGDSTPADDELEKKPDDEPAADDTENQDNSTPSDKESDDKSDDKSEAEKTEDSDDSTPADDELEKKPDDEPAAEKSEGISDAYYRAAKHQGWDDEEIKNLYDANPKLANKTFAKLLESTNRLSQEFAAIGRAKQQQIVTESKPKEDGGQQKSEFKGVDIAQLKKDYDNDPIIELVEQMQNQNKQLSDKIDLLGTPVAPTSEDELRVKLQQEEIVQQQVEQYFKADDLKSYNDFYGAIPKNSQGWDGITTEQKQNRWSVLELAEQILTGAEMQGRKMDVNEALGSAHLIVSEPIREKIIRENIKSKAVKRNKGLTLKPNSGNAPVQSGPMNQETLEASTSERLRKVFE